MITLQQSDFREITLPKDKRILSITDPPYNIKFKYGVCKDNLSEQEYIKMLSKIPKPCVIIHYPEETIRYVIPALGNPEKVLMWCYNSHLPRAVRMISFFGIKPNLSKYKIPYRNPTDKRVKQLIENGSQGTSIKEWFVIEQVKNVSKEYQGYANQIPEELIRVILSLSEGQFDTVFDPFCGSGTTLKVGVEKGYDVIGTDIDENAILISKKRLEVKVDGTTTNGIPSKTKVLGILPNEL